METPGLSICSRLSKSCDQRASRTTIHCILLSVLPLLPILSAKHANSILQCFHAVEP